MNTYIQPIIATEKFSRLHWPTLFACAWIGHYLFAFLAFQFNAGLAHCRALSRHKFEKKPISYFNKNNARSHLPLFCMSENNSSRNSLRFGLSSISYNWKARQHFDKISRSVVGWWNKNRQIHHGSFLVSCVQWQSHFQSHQRPHPVLCPINPKQQVNSISSVYAYHTCTYTVWSLRKCPILASQQVSKAMLLS